MNRNFNKRGFRSRKSRGGRRSRNLRKAGFKNAGSLPQRNIRRITNYLPTHGRATAGVGFPDTYNVTLCYSNDLNLASNVGEQQMIYEGNNPWDPDPQLGGRSADQYQVFAQVYKYCRVYGSMIEVNYNCINSDAFQCTVVPLADNPSISYEMLMCLPRAKTGRIVTTSGISSSMIVNDANTASICGIRNLDYDIGNTFSLHNVDQSTTVTEPARKWYWHVAMQTNATQNSLNGACKVRIFYRCHFYGRKFAANLQSVTNDGDDEIPVLVESNTPVIIEDPPPDNLINKQLATDELIFQDMGNRIV